MIIISIYILFLSLIVTNCSIGDGNTGEKTTLHKPDNKKQDVKNSDIKNEEIRKQIENIIGKPEKNIIEIKSINNSKKNNENNEEKIKELKNIINNNTISTHDKAAIEKLMNDLKEKQNHSTNNEQPNTPTDNPKNNEKDEQEKDEQQESKINEKQEYLNTLYGKLCDVTSLNLSTENVKNTEIGIENDPIFNVLNMYVITNKDFENKKITVKKLLEKINDPDKMKTKILSDQKKYNKKYNFKIDECQRCHKTEDCECDKNVILTETHEVVQNFDNNYQINKEKYQKLSDEYQRAIVIRVISFVNLLFEKFKFCLFQRVDGYSNNKIKNNTKDFKVEDNIGKYVNVELQNKIDKNGKGLVDKDGKIRGKIYNEIINVFTIEDLKIIEEQYLQKIPEITDFIKENRIEIENKNKSKFIGYKYYFDFKSENDENLIKDKYLANIGENNELTQRFNNFLNDACLNMINKLYMEKLKEKNKNKRENNDPSLQFEISANFIKHFFIKE